MSNKLREELGFEIKEVEETKEEANNYRVFFANGTNRKANLEEVVLWSVPTQSEAERERLREAIQEAIRRGKTGDMSYGIGTILTEALADQPKEETNEKPI